LNKWDALVAQGKPQASTNRLRYQTAPHRL